jgi:hypothetical protein
VVTDFQAFLLVLHQVYQMGMLQQGYLSVKFTFFSRITHLKYLTLIARNPSSPNFLASALHVSSKIFSTNAFVRPYTDSGWSGDVSGIGMVVGVP